MKQLMELIKSTTLYMETRNDINYSLLKIIEKYVTRLDKSTSFIHFVKDNQYISTQKNKGTKQTSNKNILTIVFFKNISFSFIS